MGSLLVEVCKLLVVAYGIQFPDQGSNSDLLNWEHGVPAIGPSGKFLDKLSDQYPGLKVS